MERSIATFVLGDVVGSTRHWETAPESMPSWLAMLDASVDAAASAHGGVRPIEQGEGDSFVVVFERVSDALSFAIDVQRAEHPLEVRVAIHTGEAERRDDGRWLGPSLNRCARLRALAGGSQLLVSGAAAEIAIDALPSGASLRDLGRHRLRDLTAPEHVRQLCHPDLRDDFPPLASLDRIPNNLPVELTSFVGRDHELGELDRAMRDSRVVTLTGAGGSGKTRLAVEAAARAIDRCRGGVWVADLAATADPALVPHALAAAMQLPEQSLQSMTDTLVARLGDDEALVILDNCEHLLDASATLAGALVRSCPNVTVLATSREALGIEGEVAHRVPSLGLPTADDDVECESVRLFVDRALAVRPTFTLDDATRPAVVELCRRLDGLPLAIELAASRCRAMAPAEIAEQLSDRFRILSAGRRAALPRQRTLEASVRWSHDLLDEEEQKALRRLAVFAGGFTLDGAERVVAEGEHDAWRVVDVLTSLVDKSLVHTEDIDGRTRYRLLETVRVFAAEHLDEASEVTATRDRHLTHMIEVAESSGLDAYASGASYRIVEREIDNLRAARDWAIERGDSDELFRMLAATSTFWEQRYPQELVGLSSVILALPGGDDDDRARVLFELGIARLLIGDFPGASHTRDELRALAEATASERIGAIEHYISGMVAHIAGDESWLDLLDGAIATFRRVGDRLFLANALQDSSLGLAYIGRIEEAVNRVDEALAISRAGPDDGFFSATHAARSIGLMRLGRLDEALRAAAHVEACPVRLPLMDSMAMVVRAWVRCGTGEHDAALALAEDAARFAERYGIVIGQTFALDLVVLARWRAGLPEDPPVLDQAEAVTVAMGFAPGAPQIDYVRAMYALQRGDVADAAGAAKRASECSDSSPFGRLERPMSRLARARVALAVGDLTEAEDRAHEALSELVSMRLRLQMPDAIEVLGRVAARLESHVEAARLIGGAHAMRTRMMWCAGAFERHELDALASALTSTLGEDAFAAAFAEGEAMTEEELVGYASRGRGERKRPSFGWESLTPAERDVVEIVAAGLSNKEIAAKLFISPATVRTHLTHVFAKLGLANRAQLIVAVNDRRRS